MSPHPSITAPPQPLRPRQTVDPNDPYGISSMMASLSSEYPDLYSDLNSYSDFSSYSYDSNQYLSSLMSEYESLTAQYSLTDYSIPTLSPTAGGSTRTGLSASAPTNSGSGGGGGGMSPGAKIGIGVGVALGVLLLAGVGILIWCMGKKKGKKNTTTIVAPAQPAFAAQPQQQQPPQPQQFQPPQPQMGYVNNQGYMQGVPQQGYPQHGYPPQTMSPPPQYVQPQQGAEQHGMAGAYGAYAKGPEPNVAELEHEYHFARPGAIEMDGMPEQEPQNGRNK
jgi:hypothetical protein